MRVLLQLGLLALGAVCVCAIPKQSATLRALVRETLTLLSTHRTLLKGNETLRISVPAHKNHQLCIEEIFQGIDTLKNQTTQGEALATLFQNLSLIKKHIDLQKQKCGEERRRVKQFLDYLQEFLAVINTEWTIEG
ncbi:interleukin-5 precursor [Cavia porcellus]|uniref:Interleukin-5 n=1 Tax=Cavia porcellus TaxID=10141 RepID=IL5_CAVPO|nr:interleukin-5 precursor [Cavia porcellus]O08987.1 RecName: Full=Interleukin-5; Short=IL-5; AltName: Full=Eosinophil differentiation factor; AltName: Full=T-cell replacing factor; Short=TRF; Flags: Precursor [Cavia porcellus]AAB61357.1 interleukin-5 [Cavia porcellus]